MKTIDGARVYRFHNMIAVNFDSDGELSKTFYLDPDVAQNLVVLLADFADDIVDVDFQHSLKRTMLVNKTDDGATTGTERADADNS